MVERPHGRPPDRAAPDGPPPDRRGESLPPGLERACREHLDFVRKNCPGLLPTGPVRPGDQVEPIPVDVKRATALVGAAVTRAALGDGTDGDAGAAVWTEGADTLLVLLDSVRVRTTEGLVTVGIDVACDQVRSATGDPRSHVDVDLAVGTTERPTGLLAAAPAPRGPAVVVDRWQDALVALVWQALLDTAAGLATAAGSDTDGAGLIPTRWSASDSGLAVGAQARHPFDRVLATSSGTVSGREGLR